MSIDSTGQGRCRTCKHRYQDVGHAIHLGGCSSPAWQHGYSIDEHDVKDDGILVENDEGWAALMGPDFGCVHWEAKEESPKEEEGKPDRFATDAECQEWLRLRNS